jgi:transposase-like protein
MKSKYSAEEKFQIVMESFADNVTRAEICRRHGIYAVQLSKWREQFIHGGKSALARGEEFRFQRRRDGVSEEDHRRPEACDRYF